MAESDAGRGLRSPLTLAVLTLLAERPRHPYEMKVAIREREVGRVVKLRGGSLYDAVQRLERAGMIGRVGTARSGARPERTVYAITPSGRECLTGLLEEFVAEPVNEYPRFVAALAHLAALSPERAAELLIVRADRLERESTDVAEALAGRGRDLPRVVLLEVEYVQRLRRVEIDWLRDVSADIGNGALPWPLPDADQPAPAMSLREE